MNPSWATATAGAAAQCALIATFTVSSVQKAAPGRSLRSTLRQLGLPEPVAQSTAYLLVIVEAAAGVALALAPGNLGPYLVVGLLGVLFAGAGARALWTKSTIDCGCFGAGRKRPLGWRQVLLLP